MSTGVLAPTPSTRPFELLVTFVRALLGRERRLAQAGFAILALMVPTTLALLIDERTLYGISVWVKPLKFQLSVGLYLLTLAWFFGALPDGVRRGRFVGVLVAAAVGAGTFEIGYIALQAARGLASHYNVGDPFHGAMYTLMGVGAVTLTAVSPALAALLLRHRPGAWSTAFWLSAVLGLTLTFVLGAGAGAVLSAGDGHWIGGVRSDAGGVPVFGWSRTGGDLRVAHFLGMHALHVLPVVGYLAARVLPRRVAVAGVWLAALVYCLATALVFTQALRGMPLIAV
jgi:hypothetical protein